MLYRTTYLLSGLLALCGIASAGNLEWSLELLDQPDIAGPPSSTIGWGYRIRNLDPVNWLLPFTLDADLFQHAAPLAIFDFPVVAPDSTVTLPFNAPLLQGLYQLTWDPTASAGFTNSGAFVISAGWFDADPLVAGNFLDVNSQSARYSATVGDLGDPVPEPATVWLGVAGLSAITVIARRRRTKPSAAE